MTTNDDVTDWQSASLALLKEPHDFSLWQKLIYSAEYPEGRLLDVTSSELQKAQLRQSYESLLRKYPLLSKYWIAYSLWERKLGDDLRAEEIFNDGLRFVALDLTYWVAYLTFKVETISGNIKQVFELFEEARQVIGFHYYAFEFYALYINFLKTYATSENDFENKLALLLRLLMDIPLYDNAEMFKEILSFIEPKQHSFKHLTYFLGEDVLKSIRKDSKNNSNIISKKIGKIVSDAFVVAQYKCFDLYAFEKDIKMPISCGLNKLAASERDNWEKYLTYVELNYPFSYVGQLFERVLLLMSQFSNFYTQYANYLISHRKFEAASVVLQRGVSILSNEGTLMVLLQLIDLQLYLGHVKRARDLVASYIMTNKNVPAKMYGKLLEIEALMSLNEGTYMLQLAKEITDASTSKTLSEKIKLFSLTT